MLHFHTSVMAEWNDAVGIRHHDASELVHAHEQQARERYAQWVEDYVMMGAMLTEASTSPNGIMTLCRLVRDSGNLRVTVSRFRCQAGTCTVPVTVKAAG